MAGLAARAVAKVSPPEEATQPRSDAPDQQFQLLVGQAASHRSISSCTSGLIFSSTRFL